MNLRHLTAALVALFICLPANALQFGFDPSEASAELHHRIVGSRVEVIVTIEVQPDWHLYGETLGASDAIGRPTAVTLEAPGVTWDAAIFPRAHKADQEYGLEGKPTWAWVFSGNLEVLVTGTFEGTAPETVTGKVTGLTCSDVTGLCVEFESSLNSAGVGAVEAYGAFAAAAVIEPTEATPATPSGRQGTELWQFILLCIGGGLFTLLMPCTYPMIPITISFFTKQAEKNGKPPLSLSLAYGIGIIAMFEVIGFLVGPVIITFAQHWLTNAVIGIVFIYFAMVLLGIVNLQPPRFLMNAAGGASQKGGFVGVFLMGATLVITSFTCTAPILGSILGASGEGSSYMDLALGMGAFGLTMAIPFFVLSMVPGKLSGLPSAGEWMNTLKVTLGFVELAAALKFLSSWDVAKQAGLLPDEILLLAWIVILGVATAYLFGIIRLAGSSAHGVSPVRALFGTGFLFLVGYLTLLLFGYPRGEVMTAFLPGYSNGSIIGSVSREGESSEASAHVIFEDDYDGALAVAREEGKLLLVNLTGFT